MNNNIVIDDFLPESFCFKAKDFELNIPLNVEIRTMLSELFDHFSLNDHVKSKELSIAILDKLFVEKDHGIWKLSDTNIVFYLVSCHENMEQKIKESEDSIMKKVNKRREEALKQHEKNVKATISLDTIEIHKNISGYIKNLTEKDPEQAAAFIRELQGLNITEGK